MKAKGSCWILWLICPAIALNVHKGYFCHRLLWWMDLWALSSNRWADPPFHPLPVFNILFICLIFLYVRLFDKRLWANIWLLCRLIVLVIDRGALRSWEIICLVASVCPPVCPSTLCILHYVLAAEWSIYGLGVPSAKEKHHDTWNTAQDLCGFVSNQGTFAIKELRAAVGGF